jgi:hypothetical protein
MFAGDCDMKRVIFALIFAFPSLAWGQSQPNWTRGVIPSAPQWNALWAAKQDLLGYTPFNRAGDTATGTSTFAGTTIISGTGTISGVTSVTGALRLTAVSALPTYADDTAARAAGKVTGDLYRNGSFLMVVQP